MDDKKKPKKPKKPVPKGLVPFTKNDPRINRKGAPKKIVRLRRLMTEILGVESTDDLKESDIGKIIVKMISSAHEGNMYAAKELLDRLYGKPTEIKVEEHDDDDEDSIDYSKLSDATLKEIISTRSSK